MFAFTPKDRRTNGKKIYIVIKFTCKTAYAVCIRRRKGISRETRTKQRKVPFSRVLSESFVSLVFFLVPRETRQKYICLLAGKPANAALQRSLPFYDRGESNDTAFYSVILENSIPRIVGKRETRKADHRSTDNLIAWFRSRIRLLCQQFAWYVDTNRLQIKRNIGETDN